MGKRRDVAEKIYEPEFIWAGKEPDNPDWDDRYPEKVGRRLSATANFVGLYILLPLTPFSIFIATFYAASVPFQLAGYETGNAAMIVAASTVAAITTGAYCWFVVLRLWRRVGFLRHRWPLPLEEQRR